MYVFRYDSVDEDARLDTWYELRTQLYVTERLITDDELDGSGRYLDAYDPHSEHVLMFDEAEPDRPIGTCRIIDGRRTRLQVGHQFGVEHGPDALEVSLKAQIDRVVPSLRAADAKRGHVTHFADLFEREYDGRLDITTVFGMPHPEEVTA